MDELLTDDQMQLRESAARLCRDFGGAKRARSLRDGAQELDAEAWRAMRAAGWLGILVPEARGGSGLGMTALYLLAEQIGRHAVMVPMLEAAATAWLLGRSRNAATDAMLRGVLAGERLVVPALQSDGWDFRRQSKSLDGRYQDNALVVSGTVAATPFASSATDFLVRVGVADETILCLASRGAPSCRVSFARHVDGSSAGAVTLTEAAIDGAHILARGDEAEALAATLADLLALGASVALLGLAESALAMTLDHLKTRRQFGRPLGSFQALQHRVVDGFVAVELDRSLLHRICLAWDEGSALPAMIAAAKARMSRNVAEIMRMALQFHGAIGYSDEHDIGILFKHALVLASRYGNEFAQSERFARLTMDEGATR